MKKLYVICYDISEAKRRARVARALEKIAARVQGSVFEAVLTKHQAQALFQRLNAELDDGDSLRLYPLPESQRRNILASGVESSPLEDYWLI